MLLLASERKIEMICHNVYKTEEKKRKKNKEHPVLFSKSTSLSLCYELWVWRLEG